MSGYLSSPQNLMIHSTLRFIRAPPKLRHLIHYVPMTFLLLRDDYSKEKEYQHYMWMKSCDKPITFGVAHKSIGLWRLTGLISPGILICRGVQKKYDSLNAISAKLSGSTRSVVKQQVVECNGPRGPPRPEARL